ncbi:MAG: transporter substrate-binding domain-containing protein [Clostridia bacterium]|nr:transporter substrate-binding domain-containing protein [Clostridia bacterium]
MKKIVSLMLAVLMMVGCMAVMASCNKGANVKIGVQSGTTGELFLKGDADWGFNGYSNVTTSAYNTGALAVKDLLDGKVDYVVIDAAVAKSLVANNPGTKVIDYALTSEDFGIGVDKNQPELLAQINNILEAKKDEIAALYTKYADVTDDNASQWTGSTVTSAAYDASKNQLVVATNAQFPPYEFTVGNAYAGIDMEIAKMIADELGMELVISDMDFEAVVSSIGKNGVDIALSGLTINPAREQVIDFSTPYEEGSYQVIIALESDDTFDGCKSAEDVLAVLKDLKK